MYSTRSSSGVLQAFSFVANIPATHTAEITAAIPITAIAIHRSLLLVFFRLFLLFPFFILTSIHFALLIWSYSIFNVHYSLSKYYIRKILEQKNFPFVLFYSASLLFIYYMCKISHQKNIFETHCTCVNITSVRFISQVIFIQKGSCREISYIFAKVIPFSKSLLFSRVSKHPSATIFK